MTEAQWDIIRAEFVTSAVKPEQYPEECLPEVACIGRSNVGKSTLINSLCRRKGLAHVSSTPGKTQTLNYYRLGVKRSTAEHEDRAEFYLVDLPGYGFAKASRSNKDVWSGFIGEYLSGSENLQLVLQLIDIRREPLEADAACYEWLRECGLDVHIVLTKADKVSRRQVQAAAEKFRRALGIKAEEISAYSSLKPLARAPLIQNILAALSAEIVEEK